MLTEESGEDTDTDTDFDFRPVRQINGDTLGSNLKVSTTQVQIYRPQWRVSVTIDRQSSSVIQCTDTTSRALSTIQRLRIPRQWRLQRFMTMLRMGVLLPMMAKMEASGPYVTFHASAVEKNGSVTLFPGLNGCGKSGLAWHLVMEHGYRLVSDNYVVVNTETLETIGVPEPLRLPSAEESRYRALGATRIATVFNKHQVFLPSEFVTSSGCLRQIMIASLGPIAEIKHLTPMGALISVVSANSMLQETPGHEWPTSFHAVNNQQLLPRLEQERLSQLFDRVSTYAVMNKRSDKIQERYACVLDHLQRA